MTHLLLALGISLSFLVQVLSQGDASHALPSTEEVLEKYVRALGGRAAYQKLTSRVATGEWENATRGTRVRIEIYAKAPDKRVEILDAPENRGLTGRGYDGATGWSMNLTETGLRRLEGPELSAMRRNSGFYREISLELVYKRLTVVAKERIEGHEVFVIEAAFDDGRPEKLFFDSETGLLSRRDVFYGTTLVSHYYEDYREVDGIKLPFTVRSEGPVRVITRLSETRHNVQIDDSKFKIPNSN